jgi:hypothetical protein
MATVFDRAGMATTTTGTGTLTLGSSLGNVSPNLAAFMSFAAAGVANGQSVPYLILDANNNWEVGIGTYTSSGTTLSRSPLWSSAGAGTAINLSGNAQVFITEIAEDINQASFGGWRNKFRNPNMDIWQRGTSSVTATTAGAYVADGWIVVPTGASCTAAAGGPEGNVAGFYSVYYALQVTGATGVTDIVIRQRIESYVAAPLSGQTVTVQAAIYNNTGATITPALTVKHAGSQDNWSSPTTDVNAVSLQSCPNAAWTIVAYTFACSASAYNGLEVDFDFGNNFSTNAKYVMLAAADIRVTSGVSTGLNNNPPPPELRPIGAEMALNQRYFRTSYPQGTAPGAVTTAGQRQVFLQGGAASAAWISGASELFGAPMRAAPSVTLYSPATGASGKIRDVTNGADVTGSTTAIGDNSFVWFGTLSAAATSYTFAVQYTATAEL